MIQQDLCQLFSEKKTTNRWVHIFLKSFLFMIIISCQVLKKRTKEVRQEEQRNKKKNRHKEKKEDKAADEVLSGEVEWEVYFNKVQNFCKVQDFNRVQNFNKVQDFNTLRGLL